MSQNLKILGEYSTAMMSGDTAAVFDFWAPEFHSHVTDRVAPERVGKDVRGTSRSGGRRPWPPFPDMEFTVDLLIEKDDLIVSNWTVKGTHTGAPFFDVAPTGAPVEINGTAILRMQRRQDRRALGRAPLPEGPRPDPVATRGSGRRPRRCCRRGRARTRRSSSGGTRATRAARGAPRRRRPSPPRRRRAPRPGPAR